jgi:anti-sigma B factor antagonist
VSSPADAAPALSLNTFAQDDTTGVRCMVVQCSGELIYGSAGILHTEVKRLIPETKRIVLDLTGVTRMDSMGLGSIVSSYVTAKASGCDVKLINLGKRISEIFRIANLSSLFEHYTDMQIAAGVNQIGPDRDRDV